MPCNNVVLQTVSLKNALPAVLRAALTEARWSVVESRSNATAIVARNGDETITWQAGKGLTIASPNPQFRQQTIVQAYSRAAVQWAAQRAGWTATTKTATTLTLTRR